MLTLRMQTQLLFPASSSYSWYSCTDRHSHAGTLVVTLAHNHTRTCTQLHTPTHSHTCTCPAHTQRELPEPLIPMEALQQVVQKGDSELCLATGATQYLHYTPSSPSPHPLPLLPPSGLPTTLQLLRVSP